MILGAVLSRLDGVRHTDNGWMALCPAHADRSPSLSVRSQNGRLLLHCFAGFTVEDICTALGIRVGDLFTKRSRIHKSEPPIVRHAQKQLAGLRSRLAARDHERPVTVVLTSEENLDAAIARALAIAVEGELVQVTFDLEVQ